MLCRVSAACVGGVALYEFGGGATYVIQQGCIMYMTHVHPYIYIYILYLVHTYITYRLHNEVKVLPHARPRRTQKCPAASRDDAMTRLLVE